MPDQPKPPLEVWLPLTLDLGADAPPTPAVAVEPAARLDVGEEVDAYCPHPKCSCDRQHTIISMYEDEIRRVQCVSCGEVHAFRRPRNVAAPAPTSERSWDTAMSTITDEARQAAQPYSIRNTYARGDLVSHPVFELGIVSEVLPDNKVEVLFRERTSILVHAR